MLGALLQLTCSAPPALPQTSPVVNPPPCDFSDNFYNGNGINVSNLNLAVAGRFGTFRQTGPPASSFNGGTNNWVPDSTCSVNDPTRRNFRILATTGGYVDDEISARGIVDAAGTVRSEEHTSELQSLAYLVCRLLLEK